MTGRHRRHFLARRGGPPSGSHARQRSAAAAVALAVAAALLAGCTSGGGDVVVVDSALPQDAAPEPTAPPAPPKKGDKVGHIAGYVVDERFQVLAGVDVKLPAFDMVDRTDRKGQFAFVDLPAGTYLMAINHTGHQPLKAFVDVRAGEFSRLQVILRSLPPADPYHQTWKFQEVAHFTNLPLGFIQWTSGFGFEPEGDEVHTFVIEAFMDPYAGPAGGHNGFGYSLEDSDCCERFGSGSSVGDLRAEVRINGTDHVRDAYELWLTLFSDPIPELDKEFAVFITAFYNQAPPPGWTIASQA